MFTYKVSVLYELVIAIKKNFWKKMEGIVAKLKEFE